MRLSYTVGGRRKEEKDGRSSFLRKDNRMAEHIIVISYSFNIAQFSQFLAPRAWPYRLPPRMQVKAHINAFSPHDRRKTPTIVGSTFPAISCISKTVQCLSSCGPTPKLGTPFAHYYRSVDVLSDSGDNCHCFEAIRWAQAR